MTIREIPLAKEGQSDHYVPRLILKHFTGPSQHLIRYDRNANRIDDSTYSPANAGCKMEWDVFERDGVLYEIDYRKVETGFATILDDHLSKGLVPQNPKQQQVIRQMIAAQTIRSPRYVQRLRQVTKENASKVDRVIMPDYLKDTIRAESRALQDHRSEGRAIVLMNQYDRILSNLTHSEIHLVEASVGQSFHIGDSPVTFDGGDRYVPGSISGNPYSSPNHALCLPVTSRYAIIALGGALAAIMRKDLLNMDEFIFFDGRTPSDIIAAHKVGHATQSTRAASRTICGIQDLFATESVFCDSVDGFSKTSEFITRNYPTWRAEVDGRTPPAQIIKRLKATTKSYLAKERHRFLNHTNGYRLGTK